MITSGTETATRSFAGSNPGSAATSQSHSNRSVGVSSTQSSARKNEHERRAGFEKSKGVKHLTYSEMLDRKARGQCFRCGEKFHLLHKCVDRQLRVIIVGDDEKLDEDKEVLAIEGDEDKEEEVFLDCKVIGLCSAAGHGADRDPSRTMRLVGKVGEIPLMVLIDSGASHNFISPEVASSLSLKVDASYKMGVRLGDGHRIKTQGRCSNIHVLLGALEIVVEADIMELGGIDLILGIKWLETLGKVVMDWKEMTMSFVKNGRQVKLRSSEREQRNEDKFLEPDALRSIVGARMRVIEGCCGR